MSEHQVAIPLTEQEQAALMPPCDVEVLSLYDCGDTAVWAERVTCGCSEGVAIAKLILAALDDWHTDAWDDGYEAGIQSWDS